MVQGRSGGVECRRGAAWSAVVVLVVGGVLAGCGADPRAGVTSVPSPSVSWSGARVAAGSFPTVPGYTWEQVPDAEWAQTWSAQSAAYHGLLADGQAKYVRDAGGTPVGTVVVAWPPPAKGGAAAMKAALDTQARQAAEHFGTASVGEVAGHEVLEFTDGSRQPNWYWVSGDEFVMVTGQEHDRGAAFVALLAAATT